MVYRGKPSKACLQCRTRKIRCDLCKDSCGQCTRAALPCSGYRDLEQLRFRDESQTTKQKALSRRSLKVPQTLAIPVHQKARNAFFSHYVVGFSNTYDMLETLNKQCPSDGHLVASIDAVSLAFFSIQYDCIRASQLAQEKYLHALPLLNDALKLTESATSDSTLLAVLLLDLFEKITNNDSRSWMSHVNGALALVELRKDKPFRNHTGLRLCVRLSTNLLISCVAANAPVPSALMELRSDLEQYLNKDDPKWQVSGLVVKYANLRGAMQSGCISTLDNVTHALDLDHEFISVARNMPSTWLYSTTYLERDSEGVFERHVDTYADHFVTQTWNVLRIMRILLNDIVCSYHIEALTGSCNEAFSPWRYDFAIATINLLAKDICATAPQYTSCHHGTAKSKVYCETQKLKCYTLIFPLYVAGLYVRSETMLKPWIIKHWQFMSHEIGIRNADIIANKLERADGTNIWDVYAMLGSYAFAA